MDRRVIFAAVVALVTLFAGICTYNNLVGYNEYQNWQVYQSAGGDVEIVDGAGYYPQFFGRVWTYPRAIETEFATENSIRATFNDGGTAMVSAYVRIGLPTTSDHRKQLHQQFSANQKNITDAVRAHLANCIKASGPVMSASENQASRKAEFNQIIEEQLTNGLFKMRRTEIELNDLSTIEQVEDKDGNKVQKEKKAVVQATEIVLGKDGKPIVIQESPLKQYGIQVLQFSITEIEYDQTTLEQFAAKKKSYLAAEQAKAERQQEVQQRLMVEERGRRQVADVQAEENQKRERALIQAQQAADVAVINKEQAVTAARQKAEVAQQAKTEAETLRQIAEIQVQTAELDKQATIAAAEAKQKEIELGGGISEEKRVLAQIRADRDAKVAEALSQVKVPGVVFSGASGGAEGGVTNNLMNFLLLKSTGILQDQQSAK